MGIFDQQTLEFLIDEISQVKQVIHLPWRRTSWRHAQAAWSEGRRHHRGKPHGL